MTFRSPLVGSGSPATPGTNHEHPAHIHRVSETILTAHNDIRAEPKYKKYAQQVEKCLSMFDNVQEWADLSSFLKQLLKVCPRQSFNCCCVSNVACLWQTFQSYMQFKEIPHKVIVSKRLAQCLNEKLPSGVHRSALDVYAHILAVSGVRLFLLRQPGKLLTQNLQSEYLKENLGLWSFGLFTFFQYAAISVKVSSGKL